MSLTQVKDKLPPKKGDFFPHRWVAVKELQNSTRRGGERRPVKLKCLYFNIIYKCKNGFYHKSLIIFELYKQSSGKPRK